MFGVALDEVVRSHVVDNVESFDVMCGRILFMLPPGVGETTSTGGRWWEKCIHPESVEYDNWESVHIIHVWNFWLSGMILLKALGALN